MNIFQKKIYFILIIACCFLPVITAQGQDPKAEITLTWSTNTFIPPGYIGKALPTKESSVEIVANVFSWKDNPQELFYNWFLNDYIQKNDSGKGKQIFRFDMRRGGVKNSVKVEIKNNEGVILGQSSYLLFEPQEPEIILETNALSLKYFGFAPKYYVFSNRKTVFTAQPYFFNIENIKDLNYQWKFGEEESVQEDKSDPNILIIETEQLINFFKRNLMLRVENLNNPLQKANLTAEINFQPATNNR